MTRIEVKAVYATPFAGSTVSSGKFSSYSPSYAPFRTVGWMQLQMRAFTTEPHEFRDTGKAGIVKYFPKFMTDGYEYW